MSNKLSLEKVADVERLLRRGCGDREIQFFTGVHRDTVARCRDRLGIARSPKNYRPSLTTTARRKLLASQKGTTAPARKREKKPAAQPLERVRVRPDGPAEGGNSPTFEAWLRVAQFLKDNTEGIWRLSRQGAFPRLLPGPEGSVDLHWESERHELLINIPAGTAAADFYGDAKQGGVIKGTLDLSAPNAWVFQWLLQVTQG